MTRKEFEEIKERLPLYWRLRCEVQRLHGSNFCHDIEKLIHALENGGIEDEPDENDDPELLDCPCCGGSSHISDSGKSHWVIICTRCGVCTSPSMDKQLTIFIWNTRATTPIEPSENDCMCCKHGEVYVCKEIALELYSGQVMQDSTTIIADYCPKCGKLIDKRRRNDYLDEIKEIAGKDIYDRIVGIEDEPDDDGEPKWNVRAVTPIEPSENEEPNLLPCPCCGKSSAIKGIKALVSESVDSIRYHYAYSCIKKTVDADCVAVCTNATRSRRQMEHQSNHADRADCLRLCQV